MVTPAKILLWDIETTHLKADFGTILCIGYKWLGDKRTTIISITDKDGWDKQPWNDKHVVREFAKVYNQADMIVTYYGKGFDQKYINSKLLEYGLPVLPNIPHIDLYFTVKSNMALSRKSLANVLNYLKLDNKKTSVEGSIWKKAMCGCPKSIKYIIDHCYADVEVLEEAYMKLRPLVRTHPRVKGYGPCRACGSAEIRSRGIRYNALTNPQRKVVCADCGAWDSRAMGDVA